METEEGENGQRREERREKESEKSATVECCINCKRLALKMQIYCLANET